MKRACPFDANLLKMSKVHLMDYDVDLMALQKVHDNTLKKLKDGARFPTSDIIQSHKTQPLEMCKTKPHRQLELTHFFKHLNESAVFQFNAQGQMPMTIDETETCSYCDKTEPTNSCVICLDRFCDLCSLKRYDAAEEMHVCLTCS